MTSAETKIVYFSLYTDACDKFLSDKCYVFLVMKKSVYTIFGDLVNSSLNFWRQLSYL